MYMNRRTHGECPGAQVFPEPLLVKLFVNLRHVETSTVINIKKLKQI